MFSSVGAQILKKTTETDTRRIPKNILQRHQQLSESLLLAEHKRQANRKRALEVRRRKGRGSIDTEVMAAKRASGSVGHYTGYSSGSVGDYSGDVHRGSLGGQSDVRLVVEATQIRGRRGSFAQAKIPLHRNKVSPMHSVDEEGSTTGSADDVSSWPCGAYFKTSKEEQAFRRFLWEIAGGDSSMRRHHAVFAVFLVVAGK